MNKAAFFDRDGTINIEKNYLYRIEDFEFVPGIVNLLKRYKSEGYLLILITNQSGIARGYYTVREMEALHKYMQEQLAQENVAFDAIYYCPHHPEGIVREYAKECQCRKPKDGLFRRAMMEWDIDPQQSVAVGDKLRDIEPAIALGMKGILV